MKLFSRSFTKKEKVLIVILIVLLLGLVYYQFVDKNVRDGLETARSSIEVNKSELEISNALLASLTNMDEELTDYEAGGASYLASYNNINEEIALMDDILSSVTDYTLNLQDPTLSGDLVRRDITIHFTTNSYDKAVSVMKAFSASRLRNVIRDISFSNSAGRDDRTTVAVDMTVTFYETMAGGTPDAGLIIPETQAATE